MVRMADCYCGVEGTSSAVFGNACPVSQTRNGGEVRDEREKRDARDGLKAEVFGTLNPNLQPSAFDLARLPIVAALATHIVPQPPL